MLTLLVNLYSFVVLAAVIVSWVGVSEDSMPVRWVRALTEPVLRPIRRVLPPFGGLDFSPLVLLLLLQVVGGAL